MKPIDRAVDVSIGALHEYAEKLESGDDLTYPPSHHMMHAALDAALHVEEMARAAMGSTYEADMWEEVPQKIRDLYLDQSRAIRTMILGQNA